MKITQEMLLTYASLTERNAHGEMLLQVSKDLNLPHYVVLFESINKIHDTEGHMSFDVHKVRSRFRNELLEYLYNHLPQDEFRLLAKYL